MKKMHKRFAATVVAAGLSLASITGCAAAGGEPSATDDGAASVTADLDATLRTGSAFAPENLDPHVAPETGSLPFLTPLYDGLLRIDMDQNIVAGLATEWKFVDDYSAFELTLRDDVDFHDGAHFDAAAAKANLDRAKEVGAPSVKTQLAGVSDVVVVDDYTVRLNLLPGTGVGLPLALTQQAGLMASPEALDSATLDYEPAGSGPYVLEEGGFRQSDTVTYVRAEGEHWYGNDKRPAKIVMTGYADQTALLNALQSGEVDLIMSEPSARLASFTEDQGYGVNPYAAGYYMLALNLAWPGLEDVRVRQALSYAIDRDALNEGVLFGGCTPTNQPLTSSMDGYVPELEDLYEYNPDRARELLAEAGYPDGIDLPAIFASASPYDQIATALQGMLSEVGVRADWQASTLAEAQKIWIGGERALSPFGNPFRGNPSTQLLYFADYPAALPGGSTDEARQAAEPLRDPSLEGAALTEAREAMSRAAVETVPTIVLCHRQRIVVSNSAVQGADDMPLMVLGAPYDTANLWMAKKD